MRWLDKRYHSFNYEMRKRFGEKVGKLSINGGFTCPNRDGTLGTGGCAFCDAHGAGKFGGDPNLDIPGQMHQQKLAMETKWRVSKYIAYFQSFTNTYGAVDHLQKVYQPALDDEDVVQVAIATRPDCLPDDVVAYLAQLNQQKPLWVELGLQSIHGGSLKGLNQAYGLADFRTSVEKLHRAGIEVVAHVILGLPGETLAHVLETIDYLVALPIGGIKLHLLHVLEDTALADRYTQGGFSVLDQETYTDWLVCCLERIPPDVTIHRLTGDGSKDHLIAPRWPLAKRAILNGIDQTLKERDTWQGKHLLK